MSDSDDTRYRRPLLFLVASTSLLRLWLAHHLELTSDECNGWLYARFPAPGYFDHPPLSGYLIRLTTWGASLPVELLVRLSAIVLSAATTLVLFRLVRELRGAAVAWYAALLYNASFLFTAIGIVILPDSPLYFCWLLTLYCLWRGLHPLEVTTRERRWVLLAGVSLGLALLAKYHGFLMLPGVLCYLLTDRARRAWLKRPEPWIALAIALVMFLPVVFWNYEHDWVSLRFQGGRVASTETHADYRRLLVNVLAPILYLNPQVFFCVIAGLAALVRGRIERARDFALFAWIALPVILFFAVTSVSNEASLPHWPGVGYFTLLPLAATWLHARLAKRVPVPLLPRATLVSTLAFALVLAVSLMQLDWGIIDRDAAHRADANYREWGKSDPTTEMVGWRELEPGLRRLIDEDRAAGRAPPELLIASRWYTAAHLDFYAATRLGLGTVCMADLDQERALAFMRPSAFKKGANGYFITTSDRFKEPQRHRYGTPPTSLAERFSAIGDPRFIDVLRAGRLARRFYVYRCETLRDEPRALDRPDLLQRPEYRGFFLINGGLRSTLGDWLLGYGNWLGAGYVSGPLALLLAWLTWRKRPGRWRRDVIAIVVASLLCSFVVTTMKGWCARERPARLFATAVANGDVDLHVMFPPKYRQGFPSGHTATAFLIATLLAFIVARRSTAVAGFAVAALVGISTMYIGAHLPADVIGGALVGIAVAAFACRWMSLEPRSGSTAR